MKKQIVNTALCTLGLAMASLACAQSTRPAALRPPAELAGPPAANPAPRDPSLHRYLAEFGGKAGLVAIVHDLMDNLMADPRTRPFFASVDREHVKLELVDQFCVILDGPCTYTGKDMREIHKNLEINRTNFNALVEDLQKAMDAHNVPFRAQNKLLAKLAPMHREVVTGK